MCYYLHKLWSKRENSLPTITTNFYHNLSFGLVPFAILLHKNGHICLVSLTQVNVVLGITNVKRSASKPSTRRCINVYLKLTSAVQHILYAVCIQLESANHISTTIYLHIYIYIQIYTYIYVPVMNAGMYIVEDLRILLRIHIRKGRKKKKGGHRKKDREI
jgi:hypothetical protein